MKLYLVDLNTKLTDAWKKVFKEIKDVEIKNQSIFDLSCDAIVSPANSFGFMNGGIDFAISKNLGWHIEKRLQQKIRKNYYGELLVGQATIVETDHSQYPYLISAPTMRTPMTILRSPNIYLATKAILSLLKHGVFEDGTPIKNRINTIAVPGLGTGIGQVPPLVCARQMRIAWEDVMHEKYKSLEGWEELRSNYAYFFTHDEKDLHYDIP
ncbi:macro domain-containing protein [Aureibacter tunicatorum]|uniref:O-acetyl-ADP-ribose deacetylase (Regulator of RNase III) n=1 Tax=Aureibacter tunicatorum TaxID=866807 RepID=A0AAE4BS32_9BACT|nr:macro domain-containing protein [Aureibacter tunicatorum]MDR6238468.1 O-acetyl-ADP-ribose deacetylase (regulator of RNase III) [Aureibacter tunicatorum]BDD05599.1 tail protein [Aureibacter tunicatorum]